MDLSTEESQDEIPYILCEKLFPPLKNDKIDTIEFLRASKEVVELIDKFGKIFSPLSYDMNGNIDKLERSYNKNPSQFEYIENLLLCENCNDSSFCVDALLWLKRALHFMLIFFRCIAEDNEKTESLEDHMTFAYSQTLEPYHGWVTKKLFRFFRRTVPSRTIFLSQLVNGNDYTHDVIIQSLFTYLQSLTVIINHINAFYKEYNLESDKKAP